MFDGGLSAEQGLIGCLNYAIFLWHDGAAEIASTVSVTNHAAFGPTPVGITVVNGSCCCCLNDSSVLKTDWFN